VREDLAKKAKPPSLAVRATLAIDERIYTSQNRQAEYDEIQAVFWYMDMYIQSFA
jgi:hypothetical protein